MKTILYSMWNHKLGNLLLFFFSFEELNIDIHLQGGEVCVSCESKASRPHLGDRCSGHGVDGKMTRWSWKDGARKDEKLEQE